jgi:hypothetical protein
MRGPNPVHDQRIMLKEDQAQVSNQHLHKQIMDSLIVTKDKEHMNQQPQQISSAIVVANKDTLQETALLKEHITR